MIVVFFLKRVRFGSLMVRFYCYLNLEYARKRVLCFLFICGQLVTADLIFVFEDRSFYLLSVICFKMLSAAGRRGDLNYGI